jgi:hypothetical protein
MEIIVATTSVTPVEKTIVIRLSGTGVWFVCLTRGDEATFTGWEECLPSLFSSVFPVRYLATLNIQPNRLFG